MLNAKKRFIEEMKYETEAYMYNLASSISGFDGSCADALMKMYPAMGEKAIVQMTLIACEKNPDAYCQCVISNTCSDFLLNPANDSFIISGGELTPSGNAILELFKAVLKSIAADASTPSGRHNTMQLEFVAKQLSARMK